jgi:hypothetical protein
VTTISTPAHSEPPADGWVESVARPAWLLAREVLGRPGTLSLLAGSAGIAVLARSLQPLGIAASRMRGAELDAELRWLLYGALALLVLVRAAHWRRLLHGFGPARLFAIITCTCLYLDLIGYVITYLTSLVFFPSSAVLSWRSAAEALWFSSLAGILALSRLEARILGLSFLLLVAWVPVFGILQPSGLGGIATGIPPPASIADESLPMLIPLLLALGYVCCERVQR